MRCMLVHKEIEKKSKRKDYAFRRQLNEKPSVIPGCPGHADAQRLFVAAAEIVKLSLNMVCYFGVK